MYSIIVEHERPNRCSTNTLQIDWDTTMWAVSQFKWNPQCNDWTGTGAFTWWTYCNSYMILCVCDLISASAPNGTSIQNIQKRITTGTMGERKQTNDTILFLKLQSSLLHLPSNKHWADAIICHNTFTMANNEHHPFTRPKPLQYVAYACYIVQYGQ